jgi:hypothetical protein
MLFPNEPIFNFLYALMNTPGVGGLAVLLVGAGSVLAYGLALRWIKQGAQAREPEVYAYPTPALHDHDHA